MNVDSMVDRVNPYEFKEGKGWFGWSVMGVDEGVLMELHSAYYDPRVGVTIDSREVIPGMVFFGLPGTKANGGAYAHEAMDRGANAVVVDYEFASELLASDQYADRIIGDRLMMGERSGKHGRVMILGVKDVLRVLQALAFVHRIDFRGPVIGITGTNGKTTTRALVQATLGTRYDVGASHGNLNNHIGLPLSILNIGTHRDVWVLEMGASHPGDILQLCRIARPTHGLITTIGEAHLEGFGSIDGVAKAKGELFEYMHYSESTGFVNEDEPRIVAQRDRVHLGCSASGYSLEAYHASTQTAEDGTERMRLSWQDEMIEIPTALVGSYNLTNVVAAVHVALFFNVSFREACEAVRKYQPVAHRSQLLSGRGNHVVADCYNANPTSMRVALESFARAEHPGRRVIILGGMNELGDLSEASHRAVSTQAEAIDGAEVLYVGKAWSGLVAPERLDSTVEECVDRLRAMDLRGAWILVKGSHGVGLSDLIETLISEE